jgi:alpha-glucosidase
VLGNHDVRRLTSRLGPERARVAAVLGLTLPGTLTLYYGDELGLPDSSRRLSVPRDGFGRRDPARSRDPARAPMPWDGSINGGFSGAEPWLPAYEDAGTIGVAAQERDGASFLSLYRRLLALRREHGWARGVVARLSATETELIYDRGRHRVLARVEDGERTIALPSPGRIVAGTRPRPDAVVDAVTLSGPDAVVVELDKSGQMS